MFVVNHYILHGFKRDVNNIVNVVEALFSWLASASLFKVELQVLNRPLASVLVVVVRCLFSDSHIGQVNEHVLTLLKIIVVLLNAEAAKA